MSAEGFETVHVLSGGLHAWREAGFPTDSISSDEEQVREPFPRRNSGRTLQQTMWRNTGKGSVDSSSAHSESFLPGLVSNYLDEQSLPTKKELTFLFVDIADSTATILQNPPEVSLQLVQRFMGVVTDVALNNCGDVKDYAGDGALLYFGSVGEATRSALQIRATLLSKQSGGDNEIHHRMSLSVGNVIIGVIGSALRRSMVLIGPSINLASRLLKYIPPGGIIATEAIVERLSREEPALAEQFQLWEPNLVLRGFEEERVRTFHVPNLSGGK